MRLHDPFVRLKAAVRSTKVCISLNRFLSINLTKYNFTNHKNVKN